MSRYKNNITYNNFNFKLFGVVVSAGAGIENNLSFFNMSFTFVLLFLQTEILCNYILCKKLINHQKYWPVTSPKLNNCFATPPSF